MNFHISYTNNNRDPRIRSLFHSPSFENVFSKIERKILSPESPAIADRRTALNFEKFSSKFSADFPEHPTLWRVAHLVRYYGSYDRLGFVSKWVSGSRRVPALSLLFFTGSVTKKCVKVSQRLKMIRKYPWLSQDSN